MADLMLLLDRWPKFRTRVLAALESRPELFADLVSMQAGHLGFGRFAHTAALLGWKLTAT
jgi:hypothetical protein